MSEVPLVVILVPVLGLVAVIYMFVMRKRQIGSLDQGNAGYRAGALAQRLGLTLVKGDPNYNLFIPLADANVLKGPKDGQPVEVDILLQGEKEGVPVELRYFYRKERKTNYLANEIRWTTEFVCCMSATAKQAFPEFEVTSRSTATGPITRMLSCAPTSTGVPSVDSTYMVATAEPNMAKLLGAHMGAFAEFHVGGVHLVGDGKNVSFHMRHNSSVQVGYGLYYPESMVKGIVAIARSVGG